MTEMTWPQKLRHWKSETLSHAAGRSSASQQANLFCAVATLGMLADAVESRRRWTKRSAAVGEVLSAYRQAVVRGEAQPLDSDGDAESIAAYAKDGR